MLGGPRGDGKRKPVSPPRNAGYDAAMSQITNLNRFRKQKTREQAREDADANAARFGRTKAQKAAEAKDQARAARHLDGHKRDD